MKKIIFILLILTCVFAGNAQTQSSNSLQHKDNNHRGQHSHAKEDQRHKGNTLCHGNHHLWKDHTRADIRSHHGRKGHGEKKTNGNK